MPDHDMAKIEMEDRLCKIKLGKPDDPQKVLVEITEMQTTFKTSQSDKQEAAVMMQCGPCDDNGLFGHLFEAYLISYDEGTRGKNASTVACNRRWGQQQGNNHG